MVWSEKAPAKINLSLDVLRKRDDGFHEVQMVMTTIDLADRLEFSDIIDYEIIISSNSGRMPLNSDNLVYKATNLLQNRYGINRGVHINIEKNIPIAAGLAGGSSDAAATLRGLNRMWNLGLSIDELADLGKEIGSDVPFCIYGGTAFATGRGEIIAPLMSPPNCWVVVVDPGIPVSTEYVYQNLDVQSVKHLQTQAVVNAIIRSDYHGMCANMGNVLESVTFKIHPNLSVIKERMISFGADAVLMSGSGATLFALVMHESRMHRLYNGLKGFCNNIFAVRMLGCMD